MEHTELDIVNIEFGNKYLDCFLRDEQNFISFLREKEWFRFCLNEVYLTLQKLGCVPVWWKSEKDAGVQEAIVKAKEWVPEADEKIIAKIARSILVINHFAEKRLAVTTGL